MPAMIILTVSDWDRDEQELVFNEPSQPVVGRADDCDIRLPNDLLHRDISRHHCLFDIDPPTVRVRDLGSLNGTFVNGKKIGQRLGYLPPEAAGAGALAGQELRDGDEVQVGHTVFRVGVVGADVPADRPQPGQAGQAQRAERH